MVSLRISGCAGANIAKSPDHHNSVLSTCWESYLHKTYVNSTLNQRVVGCHVLCAIRPPHIRNIWQPCYRGFIESPGYPDNLVILGSLVSLARREIRSLVIVLIDFNQPVDTVSHRHIYPHEKDT